MTDPLQNIARMALAVSGQYKPFTQVDELDHFHGPDGLARVAELMANKDSEDGYCFGCVTYWLEESCNIETFQTTCCLATGRSKIRGYQMMNVKMIGPNMKGHDPCAKILATDYSQSFYYREKSGSAFVTRLQNLPDCYVLLEIKGATAGKLVFSHALGIKLSDGCCMFFDPNYGFIEHDSKMVIAKFIGDFLSEYYSAEYAFYDIGTFLRN